MDTKEIKKFIFDIGWVLLGNISIITVAFLQRLFIARFMGAEELGAFSLIMSIHAIGTAIIAFGVPAALIKYIAEIKTIDHKLKELSSLGLIITSTFSIVAASLFVLFSSKLSSLLNIPHFSNIVILLTFIFPFSTLFYTCLAILNGRREMKSYSLYQALQNLLYLVMTIILLIFGYGLKSILLALWISIFMITFILIIKHRSYISLSYIPNLFYRVKKILQFSIKVFLSDVVNQVNVYADILLLGFFLSPEQVGYYAVAMSILRLLWIIPTCIQKITYPTISEYWKKNDHVNLNKIINQMIQYSFIIAIILGMGISLFSKQMVNIVFGAEFETAILPIQILILGFVINGALTKSIGGIMAAIDRPEIDLKVDTISVTINISLNLLLIPQYGIIGAAISKTIALLSHSIMYIILCFRIAKLKIGLKHFYLITVIIIPLIFTNNSLTSSSILFAIFIVVIFKHYFHGEKIQSIKSLLNN